MVVCWAVFEGVEYVPYLSRYDAEIPTDLDGGKKTQKKEPQSRVIENVHQSLALNSKVKVFQCSIQPQWLGCCIQWMSARLVWSNSIIMKANLILYTQGNELQLF